MRSRSASFADRNMLGFARSLSKKTCHPEARSLRACEADHAVPASLIALLIPHEVRGSSVVLRRSLSDHQC